MPRNTGLALFLPFLAGCHERVDLVSRRGESPCVPGVECDVYLPPPDEGLQIKLGPFQVPLGEEVLSCFTVKTDKAVDVQRIEIAYNVGSHHLDIATMTYGVEDGMFDCADPAMWGWGTTWNMAVGFQNDRVDWTLPEGVAYHLEAGQQLIIQSHYVNASTQETPLDALIYINLYGPESDPSREYAATLFDEDMYVTLPAHSECTIQRRCTFDAEMEVIAAFGHGHSRMKSHTIEAGGTEIYSNTTWDHPPFGIFDPPIRVPARHPINMEARYVNDTDKEIVWGPFVEDNEHFETYLMYAPGEASATCGRIDPETGEMDPEEFSAQQCTAI